jgi:hypothetical protein
MSGRSDYAELRPGDIEAVVVEFEGVAVHDAGFELEPLCACTAPRARARSATRDACTTVK